MAKIEFFALGGLDEHGKACYTLTINSDVYIINCGISTPPAVSLGVKKIIPDFNWINQNKRAIKGIFVLVPKYENFGGLEFIYNAIPTIPIYTSDVGAVIIKTYFEKRVNNQYNNRLNIRIINHLKTERIGGTSFTPFLISNTMPYALGIVFNTNDGGIVYIDDFVVSSNKNPLFQDELYEINKITKGRNLMLITGVGQAGKHLGFANPSYRISQYFDSILIDAPGRVIIGCYDDDAYKILTLVLIAALKERSVNIFSNTFNELFKFLVEKQYFAVKNLNVIPDSDIDASKNCVVIVTGTPQRLFSKLEKIISDDDDKIHLREDDTFIFAAPTIAGYEKSEADLFDDVARTSLDRIYKLSSKIIAASAANEDHKFLIDLLKPKYIIPVSGLYMNFADYVKAAIQTGFAKQNIFLLDNGQCLSINNAEAEDRKKLVKLETQFIGSAGVLDVGASSMFEREQMRENGTVLVSLYVNKDKTKIEKSNYDVVGVTNLSENNKALITQINEDANGQIDKLLVEAHNQQQLDIKNLKNLIRKIIAKQYEKKFNKRPLVLTTIIFAK